MTFPARILQYTVRQEDFIKLKDKVAICGRRPEKVAETLAEMKKLGGDVHGVPADVGLFTDVKRLFEETVERFGTVDNLVNGAGGSRKETTTTPELAFFDLATEEMKRTVDLNYLSAVIPSQAIGRLFAVKKSGAIVNISSFVGDKPISSSISYCNAKSAVNNFTRWLAVHMATTYSPAFRANAIAPGFVLTAQNYSCSSTRIPAARPSAQGWS